MDGSTPGFRFETAGGPAVTLTSSNPAVAPVPATIAMPGFGWALSDDQVAAVVNYVRSHFGNAYTDEVTAADVKAARP